MIKFFNETVETKGRHYHYLIGYSFLTNNEELQFGNLLIKKNKKISGSNMNMIRELITEEDLDMDEESFIIISISPLECDCDD